MSVSAAQPLATAGDDPVVRDLRRLAAASSAGLLAGVVVNGIGSRLAMMLLARLNPDATGLLSDDGFRIGRLTMQTASLVLLATIIGLLGGVVFLSVRDLRVGPAWFRTTSMVVGPAIVVGAILVQTDGIDFRVLEPRWLAILLFVALPGLYAYAVMRLADHWLEDGSWFLSGPRRRAALAAPILVLGPFAALVGLGLVVRMLLRQHPSVAGHVAAPWVRSGARIVLAAIFVAGTVDLGRDVVVLLG